MAVPVTASLLLLAVPSVWGILGIAGQGTTPVSGPSVSEFDEETRVASVSEVAPLAAVFEGENTLIRPEGYREWVFVGSSLGLGYADAPEGVATREDDFFHNVYIDPAGYEWFR